MVRYRRDEEVKRERNKEIGLRVIMPRIIGAIQGEAR
jgi:hypothetical protein